MLKSKAPDSGIPPAEGDSLIFAANRALSTRKAFSAARIGTVAREPFPPAPAGNSTRRSSAAWRWLPLALLAMATMAMAADCVVAQWFASRPYPGLLAELIEVCESFGNGLGVVVMALLIYQLDADRRRMLPRVLTASLGAGMAANGVKMLLARTRPRAFDFESGVLATFGEWLPLGRGGAAVQSFPSAHVATAFGLAVVLAWLYPRARWTFAALAVLVACQRMQSGSHYLSDVLIGTAMGLLVARACVQPGGLATRFERLEARLTRWRRFSGEAATPPGRTTPTTQVPVVPAARAS